MWQPQVQWHSGNYAFINSLGFFNKYYWKRLLTRKTISSNLLYEDISTPLKRVLTNLNSQSDMAMISFMKGAWQDWIWMREN